MGKIGLFHLFIECLVIAPVIWHEYGLLPMFIWLFVAYRLEGVDFILRILGKSGIVTREHIENAVHGR